MSVLFTFPGQGAQKPGMLHTLPTHAETARTLAEATRALGRDVLALDDAGALRSTVAVQLSLLVAGVAMARVLAAHGAAPQLVAGLSIGAWPAAVVAGVLEFADAVRLVELRARLMEDAYPAGYGMTAIGGLASAWTSHPALAAAAAFAITALLAIVDAGARLQGVDNGGINYLALPTHIEPFFRGLVASVDIVYFVLIATLALAFATGKLDTLRSAAD